MNIILDKFKIEDSSIHLYLESKFVKCWHRNFGSCLKGLSEAFKHNQKIRNRFIVPIHASSTCATKVCYIVLPFYF